MTSRTIRVTGAYNISKLGGRATRSRAPPDEPDPDRSGQERALGAALLGHDSEFSHWNVRGEIRRKLSSYRAQDAARGRTIARGPDAPTVDQTVSSLLSCRLLCFYCQRPVKVMYSQARAPEQWTLDRIDNSLSHTVANTVIACMACNLRRRSQSAEAFKAVKQMRIVRTNGTDAHADTASGPCVSPMHAVQKLD